MEVECSAQTTYVTERLAAGLARKAIRDWRDAVARGKARLLEVVAHGFSTSKGVARAARRLQAALDPLTFQTVVIPTRRKGVLLGSMLPSLEDLDGTEHLAITLNVFLVRLGGVEQIGTRYLAFIHPHALARMFLRLQTTELAQVRREIESTLIFYAALADACHALDLAQIIIPTRQGWFRCDVRRDLANPCGIVAKTWIAASSCGRRDAEVVESIIRGLENWSGPVTEQEWAHLNIPMKVPEGLVKSLAEALGKHEWLAEAYEERRDYLAEMWEGARSQAGEEG